MDVMIYYTGWDGKNGSHRLLLEAAADWLGEQGRGESQSDLVLKDPGTYKKPFFLSPENVRFSISHSGNLWMCAFGTEELGLDLQGSQKCSPKRLAERFFHPQEAQWLERNGYGEFLQVWAAKESYLKYTGEGLSRGMDFFSTAGEKGLKTEILGVIQRHFQLIWNAGNKDEAAAVCVTGKKIDRIRWKPLSSSEKGVFRIKIRTEDKNNG